MIDNMLGTVWFTSENDVWAKIMPNTPLVLLSVEEEGDKDYYEVANYWYFTLVDGEMDFGGARLSTLTLGEIQQCAKHLGKIGQQIDWPLRASNGS